mgnify:CR=1 FL=1
MKKILLGITMCLQSGVVFAQSALGRYPEMSNPNWSINLLISETITAASIRPIVRLEGYYLASTPTTEYTQLFFCGWGNTDSRESSLLFVFKIDNSKRGEGSDSKVTYWLIDVDDPFNGAQPFALSKFSEYCTEKVRDGSATILTETVVLIPK